MLLDRDHRAAFEMLSQPGEVTEQQLRLALGLVFGAPTKLDHRGESSLLSGEDRAEVGVSRDQNPALLRGEIQNVAVFGLLEAALPDMDRVVARVPESRCHER